MAERKVHYSLSPWGDGQGGGNNISKLSFPPPAPADGRGVFVQPLCIMNIKHIMGVAIIASIFCGLDGYTHQKNEWFVAKDHKNVEYVIDG